jgi:MerR family mercuric resistance operon transcriptional regulator
VPRPQKLSIGRIAAAAGTNVETVRYYERIGLLPPPRRTDSNYAATLRGISTG